MRRLLSTLVVCLIAVTPAAAYARPDDPRDAKKQIDTELAKTAALLEAVSAQARTAAAKLAEVNKAMPQAQQRVAEARGAVAAAQTQAATAQRIAEAARAVWERAQGQYEAAELEVKVGRERLAAFAVAAYQGSALAQFNLLMEARDPGQLVQRSGYVTQIAGSKQHALDELILARRTAKQKANEATLARQAAEAAAAQAQAALAAAERMRDEAQQAQYHLTALVGQREQAAADAAAERADVLRRYAEVKEQSEQIAAELRAWEARQQASQPTIPQSGARLLMPVRGWKSSDFGNRFDPYFRVWQLHAGVDIAAGGGEPIFAAADGRVATAGWLGGYGNYTCLHHGRHSGKSLTTCYAHQSRIGVWEGQRVSRGQLIGRVGTTGASTGNHLHFEVRRDGYPVDPLPWLPGCLC